MHRTHPTTALPLALAFAILAVSTGSIIIRFAQSEQMPSLAIAAWRMIFATLILLPLALTKYRDEIQRLTRTEVLFGVFSGIFLAAHFATWISSLEYTSVASSVVFVSTGPLWVALLSPLLLKEHLGQTAVTGLLLSMAGGMIIGIVDACSFQGGLTCPAFSDLLHGRTMWGNFLALLGAWMVSGYLIIGRKIRAGMSLLPYIFLVYGCAAITLLLVLLVSGENPFGYTSQSYWWVLALAIIPQLIGHTTFNWALKYLPASMVAVTTLGEPVGSAILAFFILNETPRLGTMIGGCLILAGIYLTTRQWNSTGL